LIAAAPSEGDPKRNSHSQHAAENAGHGGQESLSGGDRESLAVSREANRIAERANLIAEAQKAYALGQFIVGGVGVGLTAVAVAAAIYAAFYAKAAADAARDSANADNAALEQTRDAAAEARKDALEQAQRHSDQLDIAERTASAMRETARGARDANQIALETSASQLRPYVYVLEEFVGVVTKPNFAGELHLYDTAKAGFSIRNFGKTPAKNVTVRALVEVGGYWSDDRVVEFSKTRTIYRADIPPSHQTSVDGYFVSGLSGLHQEFANSKKSIFLSGEVNYEDGLGNKYRTEFNRALTGESYLSNRFLTPPSGNVST
jgi:hypothetical protein